MKAPYAIKSYIEELQWYVKARAKDNKIEIPIVRPFVYGKITPEIVTTIYYVLQDLKDYLEEEEESL